VNEALPRWRTFSASTAGAAPPGVPQAAPPASPLTGAPGHGVALIAAALGGAAGGAALAIFGLVLLVAPGAGGPGGGIGQPVAVGLDGPAEMATVGTLGSDSLLGDAAGAELVVDVAGAVQQPGLHRLRVGDRVADAIDAAGGYGPRVDLMAAGSSLNLAQPLADGTKVVVPELGTNAAALAPAQGDDRIDLNAADQAALESLPGIGPVTAGKIMAARTERGFTSVGDLLDRGIVGQAVYDDIADLVRVSG
jgi:competence protein ComEA